MSENTYAPYNLTSNVFRPVQCTEAKLFADNNPITPINGYVYFATDTKKIYLGTDEKFLPMGGNSGFYYGQRNPEEGEADSENKTFQFIISTEIEGDNTPNVDDLILNVPDGCFYRINIVNQIDDYLVAEKLTIAGSGTGGGGGGVSGSRPVINGLQNNNTYFSLSDTNSMKITFNCTTQSMENNYVDFIEYTIAGQTFYINEDHQFGDTITLNLADHLDILSTQTVNNITLIAQDAYGNRSYSKSYQCYIIDLSLSSSIDSIVSISKDPGRLLYIYTPKGGTASSSASDITKYIEITLANLENPTFNIYSVTKDIQSVGISDSINIDFNAIEGISHGVYILKATYYAKIEKTNTLVSSNTLTHQIAYIDSASNIPLIATSFTSGTVMQYSKYSLDYMVALGTTNSDINVKIHIENESSDEKAKLNEISTWTYTFVDTGTYNISIEYVEGEYTQRLGTLTVIEYSSEDVPSIDTSIVDFYLTPLGKSNTQSNREEWISNHLGGIHAAKFENFLWGTENGWIEDNDGPSLKLTNGAKLTIPTYRPFKYDGTNGLTIEIDFKFSKVSDYNQPLIKCLSYIYNSEGIPVSVNTGFQITGQKATLNSKNTKATITEIKGDTDDNGFANDIDIALQSFTQYFNEDTKIHLTYIIENTSDKTKNYHFVYTYLNGVLSGIMNMSSDESFKDTDSAPAIFEFDSTYGDINIYSIRTYRQAINSNIAITNYIADIYDIDKKIALFKNNKVFNQNSKVSKIVIDNLSSTLGVPYCVFEGGYAMPKKFKDPYAFSSSDLKHALPVRKDDYRLMSFAMYEKNEGEPVKTLMNVPIQLGESKEDNTNDITNFDNIESGKAYYFKRGVQVYGQGTSSMVYPTKNLRLKFIKKSDYPVVYKNSVPVQIVCFKADYMDSSSSHNTCTGNLVYDLYQAMNLKTPPQKFGGKYDILTAIKGFPIICFFKDYNNEDNLDEYIYIGRYNFNIDKATPEPFGFPAQYKYTGETVTDTNGRERKVVVSCGMRTELINGKTVLPLDKEGKEIEDDIVQCWEFLNNDTNSPTKFLTPEKSDGSKYANYEDALRNSWIDYYEDRYPDKIVGLQEDGKLEDNPWAQEALEEGLFRMSLWVNSTATNPAEITNKNLDVPIFYKTLDKIPTEGIVYYNANQQEVPIQKTDAISISTTTTSDENLDISNIQVSLDTFKSKVNGIYNTYNFNYDGNYWNFFDPLNNRTDPIILAEYGITLLNGMTAVAGQSIIIEFYSSYTGWTPTNLYEKHTIDNARYRLAKFKNEFTEYFDMDFSLFYYIITLVLLMMDSRAKNMMLASWDRKIWYPIFYDMDTMLGLNNTGFNKFNYDTEDDPEDKVFNGFDSVLWNNFRTCFYDEITSFYNTLRKTMTINKLLDTYNTKGADAWNEALTTQDAIYKYERPFQDGYYDGSGDEGIIEIKPGTINYLYAAQGKRSNHRAWWIRNRLNYLDSKFKPNSYGNNKPTQSEAFSFRAYALPEQQSNDNAINCIRETPANHKFKLTALANSYQSLFIGNIVYGPTYAVAGQTVEVGPTSPKHEVEAYILNPTLIKDLGDLSDKYIGSWQMPENKLTELKFGRSCRSHPNSYKNYYNKLLTSLNFGDLINGSNTPYLRYLNIARCTGLKNINLEACTKLQTLDAEGCTELTGITFPSNSILQTLYLPSQKLASLTIKNQPYLTNIKFDNEKNFPSLLTLQLDNVPAFDSYNLAKTIFNQHEGSKNNVSYILTNINWTIDDFLDDEIVTEIPILELLIKDNTNINPSDGYNLSIGLTGTIKLNGKDENNKISVDEYTIYERYKKYFPNLTITYGEYVNLTPAVTITFMSDSKDVIENNKVHYKVLGPNRNIHNKSISDLISDQGPNGAAITIPSKVPTISHTYYFTNYWETKDGIKYYNPIDFIDQEEIDIDANSFDIINPTENMIFYPIYNAEIRKYEVTFYNYDRSIIYQKDENGTPLESWSVDYGTIYDGPIKDYYYRSDDANIGPNERYKFLGWGTSYGSSNPTYFNITSQKIEGNLSLYAYYVKENVIENATDIKYFDFTTKKINLSDFGYDQSVTKYEYSISLKEEYKNILQGKITLPAVHEGNEIKMIGDFSGANLITDIFFETNLNRTPSYISVAPNAFKNGDVTNSAKFNYNTSLKNIYLPSSIKKIGSQAFMGQYKLDTITLNNEIEAIGNYAFKGVEGIDLTTQQERTFRMNFSMIELPSGLRYLGIGAFSIAGPNVHISKIPAQLKTIPSSAFALTPNVRIAEFGSDDGSSVLQNIGPSAFYNAGRTVNREVYGEANNEKVPFVDTITFYKSVTSLGNQCFVGSYGTDQSYIDTLIFKYGSSNYNGHAFSSLEELLNHTGFVGIEVNIYDGAEGEIIV